MRTITLPDCESGLTQQFYVGSTCDRRQPQEPPLLVLLPAVFAVEAAAAAERG
jgi:hypothetical protein